MPKKLKPSRYSQLSEQGSTSPIALANSPQARLKRARALDTTFLDTFPNLAEPTRLAFERWTQSPWHQSERGESDFISALKNGFFNFLKQSEYQNIQLSEIHQPIINEFVTWIKRLKDDDTAALAVNTQRRYFSVAKALFEAMSELSGIRQKINTELRFPDYQFDLSGRTHNPTRVLDDEIWETLYIKAAGSVERTRRRVEDDWVLIEENSSNVPALESGRAAYRERGIILAAMNKHFLGVLPTQSEMSGTQYVHIAHAIQRLHPNELLEGAFYPRPVDLVPFILSLAIATNYNTDVILDLKISSINIVDVLGVERIEFDPFKNRAASEQHRSFAVDPSDPASPSEIYKFIVRWTKRIREFSGPGNEDCLFLFVPEAKNKNVCSFDSDQGPSGSKSWKHNLKRWLKEMNIPHLTIRELRNTGLDKVHEWFGGDVRAVKAVAGHKGPDMFSRHYASDAAKRRNDENLSHVMATQARWASSDATIDPRGSPADNDLGAATPGWSCADPYSSPLPTERGKLCSALGACADCPLASLNFTSPYSLARVLQLKSEIELAKSYLAPSRWLAVWLPRMKKLNTVWLPRFDNPDVIADAERLSLTPFPELD